MVGEWSEQHSVDDGEHRSIAANAQGENENRNQCKNPVSPKLAKRVAQVLPEHVEKRQPAGVSMLQSRLLDSSEANPRLAPRFFRAQAAPQVFFNGQFEMRGHLRAEIVVQACAVEGSTQAVK